MLTAFFTKKFVKEYSKLPKLIQKKFDKQSRLLLKDFYYPSLHTKRKQGEAIWEARVDNFYRFTFRLEQDVITLLTIGPHDKGLGKN